MNRPFVKFLKWLALNVFFVALAYAGWGMEVVGAQRCFTFASWVLLIMAVLIIANEEGRQEFASASNASPVPLWVDLTYDIAMVMFLVWYGALWAAIPYALSQLLLKGMRASILAEEKKKSARHSDDGAGGQS